MDKTQKSTAEAPASASQQQSVKPYRLLHSHGYVRKVKKMVESVRALRGIARFPRKANQLKADATEAQKEARNKYENNRLSMDTIHFFAQPYELTHERRDRSKVDAVIGELSGKEPVNRL